MEVAWCRRTGTTSRSSERCFRKGQPPAIWRKHPEPDWTQIHQELQTHKDLDPAVGSGGRESNPDGYGHSRFCDLYRRWLKKLELVLRPGASSRAARRCSVDYAGATIPIHNPESGEVRNSCCGIRGGAGLPAVTTFAEATTGQDLRELDRLAYAGLLEFFGGVAEVVVPG